MRDHRTEHELQLSGELFPREAAAISQGLKIVTEIQRPDDRRLRVYTGDNGNISIYSDNGFYAGYKTELGGELLAYSDTEGAKMREGTKKEDESSEV